MTHGRTAAAYGRAQRPECKPHAPRQGWHAYASITHARAAHHAHNARGSKSGCVATPLTERERDNRLHAVRERAHEVPAP